MVQYKLLSVLALASAAAAETHQVTVGGGGNIFTPDSVQAAQGDIIQFDFNGRHDVVSGDYDSPCSSTGDSAIYSGIMSSGSFSIMVNSTDPIWIFCSVSNHCQSGMEMVVNPPSGGDQTLDSYKSASGSASNSQTPGSVQNGIVGEASAFSSSGGDSSSSSSASSTGSSTMSTGTATSSTSGGASSTASNAAATSSGAASGIQAAGVMGFAGLFAAFLA